jgi:hypothetical protein
VVSARFVLFVALAPDLRVSRIVVGAGIFSSETQISVAASNAHDDLPSAMAHFAANPIGKGLLPDEPILPAADDRHP